MFMKGGEKAMRILELIGISFLDASINAFLYVLIIVIDRRIQSAKKRKSSNPDRSKSS